MRSAPASGIKVELPDFLSGLMRGKFKAILGFTVASVTAALVGCAVTGASYKETTADSTPVAADQARVILLRRKDRYDDYSASKAVVRINDRVAGKIRYGGFFYVDVPPGQVKLLASARNTGYGTCELRIPIAAGTTTYVDVAPRMAHSLAGLAGSAAGAAAVGTDGAATLTEALITDPAKAGVASTAGGAMAQGAESAGKECGGPYALTQLADADALRYLDELAWSK